MSLPDPNPTPAERRAQALADRLVQHASRAGTDAAARRRPARTLQRLPLGALMTGITPAEALPVCQARVGAGRAPT